MSTQQGNPFMLPGLGLGAADQNPLTASMDMMRQAWQNMAGAGVYQQPIGPSALTTDQLDQRIADMRAVESWLRLNLSMLTSSIQALEVQRATISTIKSYMGMPQDAAPGASPLDVALGLKPSGQAKIKAARGKAAPDTPADAADADPSAPLTDAAQAWWDMLQQQFNTLAAATAASMPPAATESPKKPQATKTTAAKKTAAPRKRTAARKATRSA